MQKDMIYAPVIIPTLNRVTHLKRCLESLLANGWAKYTDVYVSVDFPPAEKYEEGYRQVKEYLNSADFSGFQSMNVVFQEKNLGPSDNYMFLLEQIKHRYDRYIFSEDDNEFSANFLEYQDKCLAAYAEDPSVMAICGAKDTQWICGDSQIAFGKLLAGYGLGTWINKQQHYLVVIPAFLTAKKTASIAKLGKLLRRNKFLFCSYVYGVLATNKGVFWNADDTLRVCDTTRSIYMHLCDDVCVVPAVAKARTWGNDGSGVNMAKTDDDPAIKQPLDSSATFSLDYMPTAFDLKNYKLGETYLCSNLPYSVPKAILLFSLFLLCGKNRMRFTRLLGALLHK